MEQVQSSFTAERVMLSRWKMIQVLGRQIDGIGFLLFPPTPEQCALPDMHLFHSSPKVHGILSSVSFYRKGNRGRGGNGNSPEARAQHSQKSPSALLALRQPREPVPAGARACWRMHFTAWVLGEGSGLHISEHLAGKPCSSLIA